MFIKRNVLPPRFYFYFHDRKGYMDGIHRKDAVKFICGVCNGTIDMHFILLVYKYEYIMNKSSYFIDLLDV